MVVRNPWAMTVRNDMTVGNLGGTTKSKRKATLQVLRGHGIESWFTSPRTPTTTTYLPCFLCGSVYPPQ
jgi:hypothetical protein